MVVLVEALLEDAFAVWAALASLRFGVLALGYRFLPTVLDALGVGTPQAVGFLLVVAVGVGYALVGVRANYVYLSGV